MKQKKKKKERKKLEKKINDRIIKDRIIKDIGTLFEQEEHYESNGDKNRNLSLDEYFNKIEPYLKNIIIDLQNSDTWKIQSTITINFISSNYVEEES